MNFEQFPKLQKIIKFLILLFKRTCKIFFFYMLFYFFQQQHRQATPGSSSGPPPLPPHPSPLELHFSHLTLNPWLASQVQTPLHNSFDSFLFKL